MIEISHQRARKLLRDQLDSRLPEGQWPALHSHLESCAECRAYRIELNHVERNIRRGLHSGWDVAPGPGTGIPAAVIAANQARQRVRQYARYAAGTLALALVFYFLGGPRMIQRLFEPEPQKVIAVTSLDPTATPAPTAQPGMFPAVVAYAGIRPEPPGDSEIYLLNPGAPPVNLTENPANDTDPAWSPDGEWIAFLSNRAAIGNPYGLLETHSEVFVTNLTGSRVVQLTSEPGITWQGPISWSRDGQLLAVTGLRENQGRQSWVYLIPLDGSGPRALSGTRGSWSPKFSRFGGQLAFGFSDGQNSGVAVYHLQTGSLSQATWAQNGQAPQPAAGSAFDWSLDGTALAYIAGTGQGQPSADSASQVMAVRDLDPAAAQVNDLPDPFLIAESRWPGAYRAVTWTPSGAVLFLEDLGDARARPDASQPKECWSIQTRVPPYRDTSGFTRQFSSLCVEGPIDSGSWSQDGRWLVALGRLPGESQRGIYAIRMSGRRFRTDAMTPTPTTSTFPGTVVRLADDPLVEAAPRVRPRLQYFEGPLSIAPQPVERAHLEPKPSNLSQGAAGPSGQLAYVVQNNNMSVVVATNPDGTGGRVLYASEGQNRCPRWSPDGQQIALVERFSGLPGGTGGAADLAPVAPEIPIVDPAHPGGTPRQVSAVDTSAAEEIYLLNADGGSPRRLTHASSIPEANASLIRVRYGCPVWSPADAPGGRYLAAMTMVLTSAGHGYALAVLPLDGGAPRYVETGEPVHGSGPVWSPDGSSIYLAMYPHSSDTPRLVMVNLSEDVSAPLDLVWLPARQDWEDINGLVVSPSRPYLGVMTLAASGSDQSLAALRLVSAADSGRLPRGDRGEQSIGVEYTGSVPGDSQLAWLPGDQFGLALYNDPASRYKSTLNLYSLASRELVPLADVEDTLYQVAWSPDGRWLVYTTESGLWGLDIAAALQHKAGPVWLSPVPVQDLDWR